MKILKVLLTVLLLISTGGCQNKTLAVGEPTSISFENLTTIDGMASQAYIIDEAVLNIDKDVFTFQCWILPTNIDNGAAILSLQGEGISYDVIGFDEDNGLSLSDGEKIVANSDAYLQMDVYNQLVLTYDKGKVKVYLNAVLAFATSIKDLPDLQLTIGQAGVDGQIEEASIQDGIVSEDVIEGSYVNMQPYVYLYDLQFNEMDNVKEDFWLYPELVIGEDSYPITWTSSNEDVIKPERNHGVITIPDQTTTVTMHADVMINGQHYEQDYQFTVCANDDVEALLEEDGQKLLNELGYIANDQQSLPSSGANGSMIMYEVLAGDAYVEDNILHKNTTEEKPMITLKITLNLQDKQLVEEVSLCLLDEYAGYLLSYFINNDSEDEKGALAYSYDGLNWTNLDGYLLSSELGTGRVRDPFIGRSKDGDFIICATEGFDNPNIYLWESDDLIEILDHQLVKVAYPNDRLQLTGERAWAPELTYVSEEDRYYIYFSDPLDEDSGSIYYITSQDLTNFSYPRSLLSVGYPIIDGTITCVDGINYMFYKDEREGAKTIFYAQSMDITQGFGKAYDNKFIFEQKEIEGPFIFKNIHGDNYYLYVDNYPNQKFYVASFDKLGHDANFVWLDEEAYSLPSEQTRHGSVIPVTQKELDRIILAYQ